MKKKLQEFLQDSTSRILELPPAFFYAGLATICVLLFAFSWMGKDDGHREEKPDSIAIRMTDFDRAPEPLIERPDLYTQLEESAGEDAKTIGLLNSTLTKLEKYVVRMVEGSDAKHPYWISDQFAGAGIDASGFVPRYSDDQISVRRWTTSKKAPVVRGDDAFEEFVKSAMASWHGTKEFRIDLKLFETKTDQDAVSAQLVVESFGLSGDQKGIQSTGIWKTNWKKQGGSLSLQNIQVQAQEEITAKISGGQLMKDCTASILKRCDSLQNQLIYGLDQWARKIPGIDIVGNHGVAIGDVNSDGLDDLYICQPHGLPNLLLIQNPDGTAENVSPASHLDILDETHAALIIDIDNDKDQDIILSTDENLLLLSNNGDATFQLEHKLPLGRDAHSISAADFDQDGDLDLFLCKYQDINRQNDVLMFPAKTADANDGGRNILLRNDEGWSFVDVTEQVGITTNNNFYSRSAVWVDYDFDGDCDLYVTNEFAADQFYENQTGWFSDVSDELGIKNSARHRSVSVGEFNQDGRFDFFVATDTPLSALRVLKSTASESKTGLQKTLSGENQIWFTSTPGEEFTPFYLRAPIFSTESSFGSATADLNNDGLDDVVVTNGFLTRSSSEELDELFFGNALASNEEEENAAAIRLNRVVNDVSDLCRSGYSLASRQRNRCYLSIGELGFANLSAISGIDFADDARAVATTDWDNDGDPDLVMTTRGGPQLRIFLNQLESENHFVHFDLVGTTSNVDAIGSRVELFLEGRDAPLVKTLQAGSGNLSQSTKRLMFGLGKSKKIKRADVFWPDGTKQTFDDLAVNTRYEILEGRPNPAERTSERFDLDIPPKTLDGLASLPDIKKPAVFYPRVPLPNLQYQSALNQWVSIKPTNGRGKLVIFFSRNSDSEACLAKFATENVQAFSENLDCVGVLINETREAGQNLELARRMAENNSFAFPFGDASESTIDKLGLLAGEWFNDLQVPNAPFALLLNKQGNLCSFYSNDDIDVEKILADSQWIGSDEMVYRIHANPLGGKWMATYRTPKLNRLTSRLNEIGYVNDAEMLATQSRPRHAYELCQKAVELESRGETNRAKAFFERAIELDPTCVMAYVGEGHLLHRLSKTQKIGDDSIRVSMQQMAVADFEQAIALDPLNTEAIIGRANVAIDQNRITDALHQLTEYVKLDPNRYEVHAIIGRLLFYQKKYPEAAKFLVTAFENRPTLPYVAGDLGFLYLSAGEYEQSQKFLSLAHRLQPSDKNILRLLAEAEFVTGRFDEAVKLFERVTLDDPSRRRSKNVLAWLLATCPYENHRNGKRAMAIMDPMVELVGETSPSTLEIYAACFAEMGEFEKALEFQGKAIALINDKTGTESYSENQKKGMRSRMELYRRQRPYRMADLAQIPIAPPGRKQ